MYDQFEKAVIEGAGGVVERQTSEGVRIAVVCRDRYGADEWSLPKGKREPGESWQKNALREVKEEIGLDAVIVGIVGAKAYLAGEQPKLVLFWRMRVEGEVPPQKPNEEVKAVEWLAPEDAAERLTYLEESRLVQTMFSLSVSPRRKAHNFVDKLEKLWVFVFRRAALKRVGGDIEAYKRELMYRRADWTILQIITEAENAVENADIDGAWKYFQTARRLELASSTALDAPAIALRDEADQKLSSWRKKAVAELLSPSQTLTAQKLCAAAQIIDEHSNNEAYKDALRRANMLRLLIALGIAILVLFLVAHNDVLTAVTQSDSDKQNLFRVLAGVALFGWLGATISAVLTYPSTSASPRIPELVLNARVTLLRLLMGPASAIVIYFAMRTELSRNIFKFADTGYIFFVVAFVAGFSERLLLKVIRAVDPEPEEKPKSP
jgi:ADP-ribose pyrophosphatase YjhB (NUDIX family)